MEDIRKREQVEEATNDTQTSDWYNLSDEEMKMYLDQIQVPGNANRIDLSVSHFIKINTDSEDTVKMRSSLALDTYDYVLAAVKNREDETREGGTHWSLLVYTRESNSYYHLDSVEPLNRPHAQRLAVALSGDLDVNVIQIQCRQQKSGVECGAYVVHYIELICSMIVSNISMKGDRCFNKSFSVNKIYSKINWLKNQNNKLVKVSNHTTPTKGTRNKLISKVTLLADSHGRNLRHLLQNQLGENFAVYSVVKSSGKSEHIVSDLDYEAKKLSNNDRLIVLSGSNNVEEKTEFSAKDYVKRIAKKTKNTNVIVCTVPLRYDKPHLNVKIRKINIELIIEALKYDHLKIL
ncbi:hypothetical protein J6590_067615 [Homalodisca vitripennis]|nr:hypothetical protein J6590_067615 [Homalodisca vitripennis]